ncbi:MAG TPA: hypothetical protein VER12_13825 [Polyangiaceae bacterium]|nr:hypothetical protein [Polyangiaceae bacterium]
MVTRDVERRPSLRRRGRVVAASTSADLVYEVAEVYGKSRYELMAHGARSLFMEGDAGRSYCGSEKAAKIAIAEGARSAKSRERSSSASPHRRRR